MEIIDRLLQACSKLSLNQKFIGENYLGSPIKLHRCIVPEQHDYYLRSDLSTAGACKQTLPGALIAGLAEFIERSSLRHVNQRRTKDFSLTSAPSECVPSINEIVALQGFNPFQFNLANFNYHQITKQTVLNWTPAYRFITDENVYIPTDLITLKPNNFFEVTTNGCAVAKTIPEAAFNATLELIERHLVMKFWWRKEQPIYLNLREIINKQLSHMDFAFGPWLKYIRIATVKNEFNLPIILAFFSSENSKRHPAFAMSAACHTNPFIAVEKALTELGSVLNYKLTRKDYLLKKDLLPTGNFDLDILNFENHHELYTFDYAKQFLHFNPQDLSCPKDLIIESIYQPLCESENEIEYLKKKISNANYNPICVDQTPSDVSQLGFKVVRALDAELIDLNSRHSTRRWGKSKLYDKEVPNISKLNHFPHPFP